MIWQKIYYYSVVFFISSSSVHAHYAQSYGNSENYSLMYTLRNQYSMKLSQKYSKEKIEILGFFPSKK